ncbi:CCR4-NOT transcription complex subunit 4 [Senna tora]|uniref:CCR4-NOT transcription complex subunit 4 n=1 Tax=Senna tora TaxID=362788 RepID=A0A834TAY4_9FABA|nr:CCR4-NOT transcription complex subunit 4 [Senna tora]
MIQVSVRYDWKLLLDGFEKPYCNVKTIVCSMSKLCWVPYSTKWSSCLRLHIEGLYQVPPYSREFLRLMTVLGTIMCDKGEKSCPICTEEMDLTDQQLKPCKCGYEICVWCWHYIMEMAEKNGTEGRCPACRTPYDKERIVAMAANCQRLVTEMNLKQKKKMQKLKPKASDGRKHLNDVRVIQRNLVYIIGLPLNLADEDLLQHKDYFGRYGKVLKVSISRTATGVVQHSANNSCCVYITYSKEAEAVRCIQSVHCFVLDGRSLRACFGTTKYCHAWLRNLACSNRDCLYLHDYGSQEDSFTKDELVLAFARSRIQQIIGATNNLHRRSGSVLPPPADDPRHMLSAAKSPLDKIENQVKVPCSNSNTRNSTALPGVTSWVMRVSGTLPPDTSTPYSGNPLNSKVEAYNDPQAFVSGVSGVERSALSTRSGEDVLEAHSNAFLVSSELDKHDIGGNFQTSESNVIKAANMERLPSDGMSDCETSLASFMGNGQDIVSPASAKIIEFSKSRNLNIDKSLSSNSDSNSDRDVQGLCTELSSTNISRHLEDTCSVTNSDSILLTNNFTESSGRQHLLQDNQYSDERSTWPALWEDTIVDDLLNIDYKQKNCCKGINKQSSGISSPGLPLNLEQSSHQLWQQDNACHQNNLGKPSHCFDEPLDTVFGEHAERKYNAAGVDNKVSPDMAESSIISNILSLELDAWEDSLVKLLGENDAQCTSMKAPTMRKVQEKNQSRFSFARQDEFLNEASDLEHSFGNTGHAHNKYFASGGLMDNKDTLTEKDRNVLPSSSSVFNIVQSQSFVPSKFSVSKASASTPPGFSLSSRIPPGFSCGRVEQDSNTSVKHMQEQYVPPSGIFGRIRDGDSEGMLAERLNNASIDTRQTFLSQFNPGEDDARLKLLMQQSQNLGFPEYVGNRFSPQNDSYRIPSRFLDQFQPSNPSIYQQLHSQQFSTNVLSSNRQWGGWNDAKNFSDLAMPEVLNNERLVYNNFISNYENIKF